MKIALVLSFLISFLFIGDHISMLGIKIYNTRESVEKLELEVVGMEPNIIKYRTEDGNDLSITYFKDRVVYMENDWLQDQKNNRPLITDFTFGQTSLKEIIEKFKTQGFVYKTRNSIELENEIIVFNCFDLDSPNEEVLVIIAKVALDENVTQDNLSEKLMLDAVILSDKTYLDIIWGEEKVYNGINKKIKL